MNYTLLKRCDIRDDWFRSREPLFSDLMNVSLSERFEEHLHHKMEPIARNLKAKIADACTRAVDFALGHEEPRRGW